jgi:hypothetical protein
MSSEDLIEDLVIDEPAVATEVPLEAPPTKKPRKKKASGKAKVLKAKGSEKSKAAKPKADIKKDQWGLRKDSTRSIAANMYARKNGATLAEVKEKVGSIQLNVLNDLEEAGFTVKREKQEGKKGKRAVTRYYLIAK